jgi:transcriptional regulator with PAS, ATPase and Fis domain
MRRVVETGEPILLDIMEVDGTSFIVIRIPLRDDSGEVIGAVGLALFDHLQPLQPLFARVEKLQRELSQARQRLSEDRRAKYTFADYIGKSAAALAVKRQGMRCARLNSTVLLLGETGTGKELLAHAIHDASTRSNKPFISVNVAAVPEALLESEFFGAAAGAYTGADRRGRIGKFQFADGGTLFLDEIGDMPLTLQAKLLRVLQEQEVEPLGANKVIRIDVRIIAATSADLAQRVADGRFRADLFYRLNVLPITLPPLRERQEDLEALCHHLLAQMAERTKEPAHDLDAAALTLLRQCDWNGNLRELRNTLEQTAMLSDHRTLTAEDFRGIAKPGSQTPERPLLNLGTDDKIADYRTALASFERQLIRRALAASGGRVTAAASLLQLGRATLYKKMAALGMESTEAPGSNIE